MAGVDESMTLVAEFVRGRGVNVGPNGESPGGMFFFQERLYNRSQTEVVGESSVRCQQGLRTYTFEATFRLEGRGKIVMGSAFFAPRQHRAGNGRHPTLQGRRWCDTDIRPKRW